MNLRWSPDPDAVERANEAGFGPFARRFFRPFDYANALQTGLAATVLYTVAAGGIALWATFVDGASPLMYVAAAMSLALGLTLGLGTIVLGPERYMRVFPSLALVGLSTGAPLISATASVAGEPAIANSVFYVAAISFGFYLCRTWAAITLTIVNIALVAMVMPSLDLPFDDAVVVWLTIVQGMTVTGALIGMIGARLQGSVTAEQAARTSLATLASDLEDQVQTQVQELEKLGQLRRFLSPQIADAVLSGGTDDVLLPHRSKIAVFFCDLRGFTAYTGNAEPEDVVGLLDIYYETVGSVLHKHRATIGGYAGDGIMAFFGDPVESAAPARDAMEASLEISRALDELAATWQDRDIPVNYGIGLATGFATLGEVGFDDRVDYTALGNVVNLAARLCDKAEPGQVLMDNATSQESGGITLLKPVEGLVLKGMAPDTKAWTLA